MENLLKYRPPRIASLLLIISYVIWHFSPPETIFYMPYKYIGSFAVISGLTTMLWAWLQFRRVKTAVCPTAETTTVVTIVSHQNSDGFSLSGLAGQHALIAECHDLTGLSKLSGWKFLPAQ